MAIKIVTAKKGEEHVTSADAGALNQGTFGTDDYVLNVGEKFRAELVSNNEIKIYDGEGMMQGRHWRIEPGTYESVTIDNGSQGKKRKDLIVARYTKDSGTGVENVELAVLKGIETEGNATAPIPVNGDIRNGDLSHEMVLYTVALDGLNVTAVDAEGEIVAGLTDIMRPVALCSFSTYWQKGSIIELNDDFTNYKYLIIKQGWDSPGTAGSISGAKLHVIVPGLLENAVIPCVIHGNIKYMNLYFALENPSQVTITERDFSKSDAGAIRQIFGVR